MAQTDESRPFDISTTVHVVDETSCSQAEISDTFVALVRKWGEYDDITATTNMSRPQAVESFKKSAASNAFKALSLYFSKIMKDHTLPIPGKVSLSLAWHNADHDYENGDPRMSFAASFILFTELFPTPDKSNIPHERVWLTSDELNGVGHYVADQLRQVCPTADFDPTALEIFATFWRFSETLDVKMSDG